MKFILLLLLMVGCASPRLVPTPTTPVSVPQEKVIVPVKEYRTPRYYSKQEFNPVYKEALSLIAQWANSDEFINYVAHKHTYIKHTDKTVLEALKLWRSQLDQSDQIEISFFHQYFTKSIGGWYDGKINQNTKFSLTVYERAGHILHETSHKYGWIHQGNYTNENDNVNSFPYIIGYDFEDFLLSKKTQLAGGSK